MTPRTRAVLLIGGLAATSVVVLAAVALTALTRVLDPNHYCETGFSMWINCTLEVSTETTHQGTPDPAFVARLSQTSATPPSAPPAPRPDTVDVTSWAIAQCPENTIARRLLCATPAAGAPVAAASNDFTTGLPRPKPWFVTTAKDTPFITSFHIETPLPLAAVLDFDRAELAKRGWTENAGAAVAPDRARVAFTTPDGPALLRLVHQDGRTIADLSLHKPDAANAGIRPRPGQVRLMLANPRDEEASITINGQTITLAAGAGSHLTEVPDTVSKSPDSPEIELPPGKYKVTLKLASGAAQGREFEVAADETWGLMVGPDGVPLAVQLY
ncbi:MAG: hypothetical protein JOZ94_23700 [Xanthobacteraceae bacterium]|nr:hypothetical protein [Xanthobacteraceae bacterium]